MTKALGDKYRRQMAALRQKRGEAGSEDARRLREAKADGHRGQHSLEICSGCRVVVMGPQYWDFD